MSFLQTAKIKIECRIPPKGLSDIPTHINLYLNELLFKYSSKVNGIVLSYNVVGVSNKNRIYSDCPYVFIECLVDFLIFKTDIVYVNDGMVLNTFAFENEENGYFKVTGIENVDGIVLKGEKFDD